MKNRLEDESEKCRLLFEQSPSFCVLPWVGLNASIDGVWGRCCDDLSVDHHAYFTEKEKPQNMVLDADALGCSQQSLFARDNPDRVFNLTEAFNSPNLRRTRLAMLEGKPVHACRYCYGLEKLGSTSHRQTINEEFRSRIDWNKLLSETSSDGNLSRQPICLDLRLGNQCNLTCIMCSYPTSSSWKNHVPVTWLKSPLDPYREDNEFWAQFLFLLPGIRWLHFSGGEPMLLKSHHKALDLILSTEFASNILLTYNTNLTYLPPGIFEKFAKFKTVMINASCDGTDETFEKIRRGAKWPVFVANLRIVAQHLDPRLVAVVQRENVGNIPELVSWAIEEDYNLDLTDILQYPKKLSLANLSPAEASQHVNAYLSAAEICRSCGRKELAGQVDVIRELLVAKAKNAPDSAS
jgi:molybdenum cofactor biosynthesis enzyme MoaA